MLKESGIYLNKPEKDNAIIKIRGVKSD